MPRLQIILFATFLFNLVATAVENNRQPYSIEFEKGNFEKGEKLSYRLHYGFVTAGKAVISIDEKLYSVQEKPCYKMTVDGWSTPFFALGFKIKDVWASYIDTTAYIPQKSVRDIEEGRYKLHEETFYDYSDYKALVHRKHPDRDKEFHVFTVPGHVQDIVSGFYELRRVNYNKLNIGDTICVKAFFDKQNYDFKVRYMGKGKVNTDAGKFKAIKLVPVMPKNGLFNGEESIKAWISDDKNKIPLLAEAEMFLGSVKLELTSYKGLKHEVSVIK